MLAGAGVATADEPDYGRFQLGPFYLTPRVVLNRYNGVSTAGYGAPGDPLADSTTTLSPSLEAVVPFGVHVRLRGRGQLYSNPFRPDGDPFVIGYGGWGGAETEVGPIGFFGSYGGGRSKDRVSFGSDQRAERTETSKTGGVTIHVGERLTATATRVYRDQAFDAGARVEGADVAALLSRSGVVDRYELSCALSRLTALVGSADVIDDEFTADATKVRSYRYLGGFAFKQLAFVHGKVMAGYRKQAAVKGLPAFEGLVYTGELTLPFFRAGDLTQSVDRDVTFALSTAQPASRATVLVTRYRTSLHLLLPFSLIAAPYYGIDEPRELGAATGAPSLRLERIGGSLFRAFGRKLRAGGGVEYLHGPAAPVTRPTSYFLTAEWAP